MNMDLRYHHHDSNLVKSSPPVCVGSLDFDSGTPTFPRQRNYQLAPRRLLTTIGLFSAVKQDGEEFLPFIHAASIITSDSTEGSKWVSATANP